MNRQRKSKISGIITYMAGLLFLLSSTSFAQKLSLKDTSAFKANMKGGWHKISSYHSKDSSGKINFEVILQCEKNEDNWKTEQYIGEITLKDFLPGSEIKFDYFLMQDSRWLVHITPKGKVLLSLVEGGAPGEIPFILPLKVHYSLIASKK